MSYVLSEGIYGIVPFLQIHKGNVANPRGICEKSTGGFPAQKVFATSGSIWFYATLNICGTFLRDGKKLLARSRI